MSRQEKSCCRAGDGHGCCQSSLPVHTHRAALGTVMHIVARHTTAHRPYRHSEYILTVILQPGAGSLWLLPAILASSAKKRKRAAVLMPGFLSPHHLLPNGQPGGAGRATALSRPPAPAPTGIRLALASQQCALVNTILHDSEQKAAPDSRQAHP